MPAARAAEPFIAAIVEFVGLQPVQGAANKLIQKILGLMNRSFDDENYSRALINRSNYVDTVYLNASFHRRISPEQIQRHPCIPV
jgi:hypothetical protein